MDHSSRRPKWLTFLTAISIFVVYFIAAKLGLKLAFVHSSATAIWAPTGIALAAFLIFGEKFWPSIFCGAFLVNFLVSGSISTSLIIAGGNTLEGLLGATLIFQFANGRKVFETASNILKFAILAEVVSTAVSATIGVTALCMNGQASWTKFSDIWITWWLGDLSGALLITPFLLLWHEHPKISAKQIPGILTSLLLVVFTGQAVFGNWLFPVSQDMPLEFLCVPPLIWIAFRFGLRDTATATVLLSIIALWNTLHGNGSFTRNSPNQSLLLLQVFMGVISVTTLALAAAISERKTAEENLERAQKAETSLQQKIELIELIQSITVAANESQDLTEAIQLSLLLICRYTGWPVGHVYYVDLNSGHQLKPGAQWFIRDENKYKNLKLVTEKRIFEPGQGLPGAVYASGVPQWIEDVTHYDNFPRAKMGLDIKVRAAFGFPVLIGKNVVAVLEFFSDHPAAPDRDLLESMKNIGTQLGRVVERQGSVEAQRQLALLVETSSDFIVTTSPDGYILYLNDAGRAMVGLEKSFNIHLLKHEDFVFEKDLPKLQGEVLTALVEKGHWEGEFHLKNFKTGAAIPIYFSAGILRDPKTGQPSTLAAIGHDVTDIKKAEEDLQNSEKHFRALIENGTDIVTVLNAEGQYTFLSPSMFTIVGYSPEELVGTNAFAMIHPDDVEGVVSRFQKVMEDPQQPQSAQYRFKHKNGTWVPLESVGRNALAEPSVRGIVINSRDLTEQKRAESEIQKTNSFLSAILENIPNMVFVKDVKDLRFVMFNKAGEDLIGVPRQDLIGKNDYDFFPKEQADFFTSKDRKVIKEGHLADIPEETIQTRDKGNRFLHTKKIPVLNEDGTPRFLMGISEDITEAKMTQKSMLEQAALLRSIIDNMGEGLLVCDIHGKTLFVNPAADQMLGGQIGDPLPGKAEMKNQVFMNDGDTLAGPHDLPITKALKGESSDNVEMLIKNPSKPNGIYILATSRPLRDPHGNITGAVSVFRDVTDEKRIEEERQRLVTLVENSRDLIVWSSPEGQNLYMNEAGREMIGVDSQTSVETIKLESFSTREELKNITSLRKKQYEALNEQGFWEGELNIPHRKTGKLVPIHLSIVILKNPKTGKTLGMATIGRDMTETREAERTLRESDMRFRSVVQSSPNAIIIADNHGDILSWNNGAEEIFGYTENEIIGKALTQIMPKKFREMHQSGLEKVQQGQPSDLIGRTIELQGLRKNGDEFPIELTLSTWKTENGVFFGGIIRDITERKKMEELLRSNTELQQFANVASHDLQEPLRMVASYVQLLEEHLKDKLDKDAVEYMGFAVDGAKRMQLLVNGLLEYSRVESRGKPPQMTDMNQIFEQTVSNLEIRIAETHAKVTRGHLPQVMGDPIQLAQLMQNLFSNALKFQKSKIPTIEVSVQETEREWIFSCKDNGIGIDPKYFERIFVIFQRLHHRDEYSGTGLGLAICKRIVERHGGRIWLESKTEQGSTFFFSLPKRSS